MFTTLKNAFKIKEIRLKLLFTLAMLVVIRFGSQLPVPGVDIKQFTAWFASKIGDSDTSGFLSAFTGGSFENMSILALNITPYITSSIIMQLLTIAIPKLEEMQKEGEDGRKKIASITRYVTVGLSLIESTAMAFAFRNSGMLTQNNVLNLITVIATLTAGSAFLKWIVVLLIVLVLVLGVVVLMVLVILMVLVVLFIGMVLVIVGIYRIWI